MYQLDEEFKKALALDGIAEENREQLFTAVEVAVNERVNTEFAKILDENQAEEFAKITSGDQENVWNFLNANLPTWEKTNDWKAFREAAVGDAELSEQEFNDLARVFATSKWLALNVPDYAQIILAKRNEVFDEVINHEK